MNDLWTIMNGNAYNGVRSRNLLLFFFALHGINIDLPIITNDLLNNSNYIQNSSAHKINIKITDIKPADRMSPDYEQLNTFGSGNQNIQQIPSFNNLSSNNLSAQKLNQSGIKTPQNLNAPNTSSIKGDAPFNYGSNQVLTPRNTSGNNNNNANEQILQSTSNFVIPQNINKNLQIGTFDPIQNWSISGNDIKVIQNHFMMWYLNRLHSTKNKEKINNENQDQLQSPRGINGQSQVLHKSQSFISPYKNKNTDQLAINHRQRMFQAATIADVPIQNRSSNADLQTANKLAKQKMNEKIKQEKEDLEVKVCTFHPETISSRSPFRDNQHQRVYDQLYDKRKLGMKRDKSTNDIMYEKECDECTFTPTINTGYNSVKQKQSQQLNAQPYVRNADQAIKRMRQAHEEHDYVEKSKARGYEFPKRPNSLLPNKMASKSPKPSSQNIKNKQNVSTQGQKSRTPNFPSEYSTINYQTNGAYDQGQQFNNQGHILNDNNLVLINQNKLIGIVKMSDIEKPIMLYVDVNLGENHMQRIIVREGDNPEHLTDDFIKYHQLPREIRPKLIELLTQQINSYLCQVDEDHRESDF